MKELATLLRTMRPVLREGVFVFCTLPPDERLPEGLEPVGTFREAEGLTAIVRREEADRAGLAYDAVFRQITLDVPSSLEAVGFTAAFAARLAAAGVPANVVAAYHHDHVFVPADLAEAAVAVLQPDAG